MQAQPDNDLLADVQGNILRGYRMRYVRHLVVRVDDQGAAQQFIRDAVSGGSDVPQITPGRDWGTKPDTCFNVGISATGLHALGLPEDVVASFPDEYLEGVARRAEKLGDVGASGPDAWCGGLGDPDRAHLMWTVHSREHLEDLEAICDRIQTSWERSGAYECVLELDGATFDAYDPDAEPNQVHYGYRDSISQPQFWLDGNRTGLRNAQPVAPLGAVLLGPDHPTTFPSVAWEMPNPLELAENGCFDAFRILEQDTHAFEQFLETGAAAINEELQRRVGSELPEVVPQEWDKELVAAKLMGRWRNGVPLSPSHWNPGAPDGGSDITHPVSDDGAKKVNDFDYPDSDVALDDESGFLCPVGAHIRRANPRGSRIVQRSANYTRPIVRRGMPYGRPYDPDNPDDGVARGLLGSFLCASLVAQFEAVMYDWINLGLQDPSVTGTNDPIIGANDERTSRFEIPVKGQEPLVLTGFPRFTRTAGSIYLFRPSLTGLRYIAGRE